MKYKFLPYMGISLLLLFFSACDVFEVRGFVLPYETADERFAQSMAWNEENFYKVFTLAEDSYSIFAMGDTHVGDTVNLNLFLDAAIEAGAVGAVMAGDLTTGHHEHLERFHRQLPPQDSLPTFPMAGNHDLYFDGWVKYYELFGSSTYYFTVLTPEASDLYICLENGAATLGRDQIAWLTEILEDERPDHRHCVIFTHTNFFRVRRMTATNPHVEELYVLTELCLQHEVDMVISGHDHQRTVAALGNTTFMTMDALKDGHRNAGWMILTIEGGDISYAFVNL
jgi:predicted phosphodiesterase